MTPLFANAKAVTPSDTGSLGLAGGLYVGVAGNVTVDMKSATNITFVGVQAGEFLWIEVSRVYATGTTASSILALY